MQVLFVFCFLPNYRALSSQSVFIAPDGSVRIDGPFDKNVFPFDHAVDISRRRRSLVAMYSYNTNIQQYGHLLTLLIHDPEQEGQVREDCPERLQALTEWCSDDEPVLLPTIRDCWREIEFLSSDLVEDDDDNIDENQEVEEATEENEEDWIEVVGSRQPTAVENDAFEDNKNESINHNSVLENIESRVNQTPVVLMSNDGIDSQAHHDSPSPQISTPSIAKIFEDLVVNDTTNQRPYDEVLAIPTKNDLVPLSQLSPIRSSSPPPPAEEPFSLPTMHTNKNSFALSMFHDTQQVLTSLDHSLTDCVENLRNPFSDLALHLVNTEIKSEPIGIGLDGNLDSEFCDESDLDRSVEGFHYLEVLLSVRESLSHIESQICEISELCFSPQVSAFLRRSVEVELREAENRVLESTKERQIGKVKTTILPVTNFRCTEELNSSKSQPQSPSQHQLQPDFFDTDIEVQDYLLTKELEHYPVVQEPKSFDRYFEVQQTHNIVALQQGQQRENVDCSVGEEVVKEEGKEDNNNNNNNHDEDDDEVEEDQLSAMEVVLQPIIKIICEQETQTTNIEITPEKILPEKSTNHDDHGIEMASSSIGVQTDFFHSAPSTSLQSSDPIVSILSSPQFSLDLDNDAQYSLSSTSSDLCSVSNAFPASEVVVTVLSEPEEVSDLVSKQEPSIYLKTRTESEKDESVTVKIIASDDCESIKLETHHISHVAGEGITAAVSPGLVAQAVRAIRGKELEKTKEKEVDRSPLRQRSWSRSKEDTTKDQLSQSVDVNTENCNVATIPFALHSVISDNLSPTIQTKVVEEHDLPHCDSSESKVLLQYSPPMTDITVVQQVISISNEFDEPFSLTVPSISSKSVSRSRVATPRNSISSSLAFTPSNVETKIDETLKKRDNSDVERRLSCSSQMDKLVEDNTEQSQQISIEISASTAVTSDDFQEKLSLTNEFVQEGNSDSLVRNRSSSFRHSFTTQRPLTVEELVGERLTAFTADVARVTSLSLPPSPPELHSHGGRLPTVPSPCLPAQRSTSPSLLAISSSNNTPTHTLRDTASQFLENIRKLDTLYAPNSNRDGISGSRSLSGSVTSKFSPSSHQSNRTLPTSLFSDHKLVNGNTVNNSCPPPQSAQLNEALSSFLQIVQRCSDSTSRTRDFVSKLDQHASVSPISRNNNSSPTDKFATTNYRSFSPDIRKKSSASISSSSNFQQQQHHVAAAAVAASFASSLRGSSTSPTRSRSASTSNISTAGFHEKGRVASSPERRRVLAESIRKAAAQSRDFKKETTNMDNKLSHEKNHVTYSFSPPQSFSKSVGAGRLQWN
jgi:hypothetical protein